MNPRHPIYIPSKGRYQLNRALTIRALQHDEVPFRLVVQPAEAHRYLPLVSERDHLLVLPDDDFNLLATRNWIRNHAERLGDSKHWQIDDNIIEFRRLWRGRRIPCHAGVALRVVEDLAGRYQNCGVAGLNYQMFVPANTPVPLYRNVHVYSISLFDHAMPCRHRLEYNDDTDICLQALASGWGTILVNVVMANKLRTMVLGGGNTDDLYAIGETREHGDSEGRMVMARVLEREWPGLVKMTRRFGRWQHAVDWSKFKDDPRLILREGVDLASLPEYDEYGLTLRAVKPPQSPALQRLLRNGIC